MSLLCSPLRVTIAKDFLVVVHPGPQLNFSAVLTLENNQEFLLVVIRGDHR